MLDEFAGGVINIKGLAEMEKVLLALPDKLARGVLVGAIQSGAKVFKQRAIENVNNSTKPHWLVSKFTKTKVLIEPGNFKKHIRIKMDRHKTRGYAVTYEVFVKNKDGWYWRFVEFGTSKMAAQKPIRRAFESEIDNAVKAVETYLKSRLTDLEK